MQETETIAFCCNQRDEVRDLNDVAGALQAQPGMKQQTFVVSPEEQSEESSTEYLTPWDTQGERIFTENGVSPTLAGADGAGGRNPAGLVFAAGVITKGNGECILTEEKHTSLTSGGGQAGQGYPCVMTAGFCANASAEARSIGFQEECSPTLKGSTSGMPSVICLNDQGGQRMDIYEDITGTLRAQMDGHPPLVLATQQGGAEIGVGICPTITSAAGTSGNNQPVLFENHGVDSRYTGPHDVSPTISHRAGTGGNNLTILVESEHEQDDETYCIAGNIIGREDENGGNGFGYQPDISYTVQAGGNHRGGKPITGRGDEDDLIKIYRRERDRPCKESR